MSADVVRPKLIPAVDRPACRRSSPKYFWFKPIVRLSLRSMYSSVVLTLLISHLLYLSSLAVHPSNQTLDSSGKKRTRTRLTHEYPEDEPCRPTSRKWGNRISSLTIFEHHGSTGSTVSTAAYRGSWAITTTPPKSSIDEQLDPRSEFPEANGNTRNRTRDRRRPRRQ
jgi:hypothetical protein